MDGYAMLAICDFCGGTIDEEIPDCGTCTCNDDDAYYGDDDDMYDEPQAQEVGDVAAD